MYFEALCDFHVSGNPNLLISRMPKLKQFFCTEPDDMYYPVLAQRMRYFKYDQGGIAVMCEAMEKMRDEAEQIGIAKGIEKGMKKGKTEQKVNSAVIMLEDGGFSYEQIVRVTGLTPDEVRNLDSVREK